MRSFVAVLALLGATAAFAGGEPAIPAPQGFVTDTAGILDGGVRARLTALATELQAKTGAEIAILTVETTAPLDDFTYAMRVADAWKPGRKREDTGLLVLLAVKDRKLRVLTGYGLEGILPDGLVGQIQDEEMMPALRAGRLADGIERGVRAFAARIAADKGVMLTGVPPPRHRAPPRGPDWVTLLVLLALVGCLWVLPLLLGGRGRRRWRGSGPVDYWGGGFGRGGFGGGGGGFGGFSGGGFGGGGAGRSW